MGEGGRGKILYLVLSLFNLESSKPLECLVVLFQKINVSVPLVYKLLRAYHRPRKTC